MSELTERRAIFKDSSFIVVSIVAAIIIAATYLALYEFGRLAADRMLSLREAEVGVELADGASVEDWGFFEDIQPENRSERAFRFNLKFPRIPKKGDHVFATKTVPVSSTYEFVCIKGYIDDEYYRPDNRSAIETFEAWIELGDKPSQRVSLALNKQPVLVAAGPVRPKDGSVEVGFHLAAFRDRSQESWQRVSLTSYEYVWIEPCGQGKGQEEEL